MSRLSSCRSVRVQISGVFIPSRATGAVPADCASSKAAAAGAGAVATAISSEISPALEANQRLVCFIDSLLDAINEDGNAEQGT